MVMSAYIRQDKFGLKALFVELSMYRMITGRKSASLKGEFLWWSGCI